MSSIIKYCYEQVIVIQIEDDVYYLDTTDGFPKVYDGDLKLMVISDYDSWLLSKTENKIDLTVLGLMVQAFNDGRSIGFDYDDLIYIMDRTTQLVVNSIFRTDLVKQYCESYWVEVLNDNEYGKLKQIIKANFEQMRNKYGQEKLYNICCRIWQYCNLSKPDESTVFEKILKKNMDQRPKLPEYPNTDELDGLVVELVEGMLFGEQPHVKNVSPQVVANAEYVFTRRL